MPVDQFSERLAKVRHRFMGSLESRIQDSYAALPKLVGEGPEVTEVVGEAYRRLHGIVGVGPTVGFTATGRAARTAENVLLVPHRAGRGLTDDEISALQKALHALREAAETELQTTYTHWR